MSSDRPTGEPTADEIRRARIRCGEILHHGRQALELLLDLEALCPGAGTEEIRRGLAVLEMGVSRVRAEVARSDSPARPRPADHDVFRHIAEVDP